MAEERLELVTDFAALRVGMIVVLKPCGGCGARHRAMLMPPNGLPTALGDGEMYRGTVFVLEPQPPCAPTHIGRGRMVVAPRSVERRNLYRVVDGLDPAADRVHERVEREIAETMQILDSWGRLL